MKLYSRDIEEGFAELEFYTVPPTPHKDSSVVFNITVGVKLMSSLSKGLGCKSPINEGKFEEIKVAAMMYMSLPSRTFSPEFRLIFVFSSYSTFTILIPLLSPISLPPCLLPSSFSKFGIPFPLLCKLSSHLVLGISAIHPPGIDTLHRHSLTQKG